jgi:menaquinone-dependent protoporphyrinogen IX oxidase
MNRILLAYTTNAGSTAEVAQTLASELRQLGHSVDLVRIEDHPAVAGYDAVIVGAPMILGWHRAALNFVQRNRQALEHIPTAFFCTLISLTQDGSESSPLPGPLFVDPWLGAPPKNPRRLSLKERYATLANYLRPIRRAAPAVQPLSIAFFGGKLELFRLKWWQMLFVMLIIQAQPGERRNWPAIRQWAAVLNAQLAQPQP